MGLFNQTQVSSSFGNTGKQDLNEKYGKTIKGLLVPASTEIATKVLALTKATWVDNINAAVGSRWYLVEIWNIEPTQEDNVKETSDFGFEDEVRKGKLNYKITFPQMHTHNVNELNKLDAKDFAFFELTDTGFICGCSYDDTKFLPFSLDYFSVLPETIKTGSANAHPMAELRFSDTDEKNRYLVRINPYTDPDAPAAWSPLRELYGIKDLVIEASDFHAGHCTLTLKGYDGTPYSAAVAADVYMRKSTATGTAIPLTGLTETSTAGVYTATFAAQTSGTFYFSLYDQPNATTEWVETPVYDTIDATIS